MITQRAGRHGSMVLLCSPEQEADIPVSYCSFPIQTPEYKPLWSQYDATVGKRAFETISKDQMESSALFQKIGSDTKVRKSPLLAYTIRMLAEDGVKIVNGRIHEGDGMMKSARDLTAAVDQAIANREF